MGSTAAGVEQQGQTGGPTQRTSENKKMKCDSKTVCWTVMVTLLLAWSVGVARGEGAEGGDQGAQGDEGGDQGAQGADTILCYHCHYSDETCTDTVIGDIVHCDAKYGCYIGQWTNGDAWRKCGYGRHTPHCDKDSDDYGDFTNCYCYTPLCNRNLDTAGCQSIKDPTTTAIATAIVILLHALI